MERATAWLRDPPDRKFLLTAGFFETHRPYPHDRYEPADAGAVDVPDYLPDTPDVRQDLADFYGSITVADAAVGELLDVLDDTGLDREHLGGVHDRPRPRAAPREVHALRRRHRYRHDRPAAAGPGRRGRVYDELFSGVDLLPTLLEFLGVQVPPKSTDYRTRDNLLDHSESKSVRTAVYTTKTYHDSFDPIRAIRTKEYSYIENYAQRPLLDLPWDIEESAPGRRWLPMSSATSRARTVRPPSPTRRSATTCSSRREDKAEAIAKTWRCCSTTGGRRPMTSFRRNSPAPGFRNATPKLICISTVSPIRVGPRLRRNEASKSTQPRAIVILMVNVNRPAYAMRFWLRLSSRACLPSRRHIWCSRRNAVAARCSSNRCGRPAWPANRRSSSSTCRPPAMSPQPRQWFAGVDDESILRLLDPLDEGKPDLAPATSGATTSAPWAAPRTAYGAAS